MNARSIGALAAALCAASSAQALNSRTWVSGTGTDATSCGTIASPCRTLQYAHDQTATGGEINFKDAAGYGSVNIVKSISIINDGVGVAGVLAPPGGNAIEINATSSGEVILKGLTIEGANTGTYGVRLGNIRNFVMSDCYVSGFTSAGLGLYPVGDTSVTVDATKLFKNRVGLEYRPAGSMSLSRIKVRDVIASANEYGLFFYAEVSGVGVAVSNTVSSNNLHAGIYVTRGSGYMTTVLDNVQINSNSPSGIGPGTFDGFGLAYFNLQPTPANTSLYIGRSTITGNNFGMYCSGADPSSFGNNQLVGNNLDKLCTLGAVPLK